MTDFNAALSAEAQRPRLHPQPADDKKASAAFPQLLIVRPFVEKAAFRGTKVLRLLPLNVDQRPRIDAGAIFHTI